MGKLMMRQWRWISGVIVLQLLNWFVVALGTSKMELIFDKESGTSVVWMLLFYAGLVLLQVGIGYFVLLWMFQLDKKWSGDLYPALLRQFLLVPEYRDSVNFGEVAVALKEDCGNAVSYAGLWIENIGYLLGIGIYLFFLTEKLGGAVFFALLALIALLTLISLVSKGRLIRLREEYLGAKENFLAFLEKLLPLRSHMPYSKLKKRISESEAQIEEEQSRFQRMTFFSGLLETMTEGAAVFFQLCLFLFSYYHVSRGTIRVSTAFSMFLFADIIFFQLQYVFNNFNEMSSLKTSVLSLSQYFREKAVRAEEERDFRSVKVRNIHLSYENRVLLNDASLEWKRGEKILITGRNGSGKSSLIRVLTGEVGSCEMYDEKGETMSTLSSVSDCVRSDSVMFADTYSNNVTLFGSLEERSVFLGRRTEEKMRQLLSADDCTTLSGGEKQLVSLLRSFHRRKPLILLDEFDSSLDSEIQAEVIDALLGMEELTVILVSPNTDHKETERFDRHYEISNAELKRVKA